MPLVSASSDRVVAARAPERQCPRAAQHSHPRPHRLKLSWRRLSHHTPAGHSLRPPHRSIKDRSKSEHVRVFVGERNPDSANPDFSAHETERKAELNLATEVDRHGEIDAVIRQPLQYRVQAMSASSRRPRLKLTTARKGSDCKTLYGHATGGGQGGEAQRS